jgi:outer membrane protein OmpA-like peptidoglycan-associated protein
MDQLKRKMCRWIAGTIIWIAVCGCAPHRTMVILVPDPDGHVGRATVSSDGGRQLLDAAGQAAVVENRRRPPQKIAAVEDARIQTLFSAAMAAEPPQPEKFNLYFRNGSTQLDGESLLMLSEILASIRRRNSFDISVNGHSDRVGPAAFNRRLSLQRAIRIRSLLIKAGVNPATVAAASHGEGNPLIRTPDNVAEPRNRRVEVIVR